MPVHLSPISAGPSDRAGLTDAPLIGIAAKWIASSVSGIAISALRAERAALRRLQDHEHEDRRQHDLEHDRRALPETGSRRRRLRPTAVG